MQDEGRTTPVEVREVFRQRKDKLQERRMWPVRETSWEGLGPGARGALKQATLVKGLRRDLLFYHQVTPHCIIQVCDHMRTVDYFLRLILTSSLPEQHLHGIYSTSLSKTVFVWKGPVERSFSLQS